MDELLPAQKKQLGAWAVQRDAIIKSIAEKRDEEKILIDSVNRLSQSETEIHDEIQRSIGRLEELKKKEAEFAVLTTSENAALREEKSKLQAETVALNKEIDLLGVNEGKIDENINLLINLFDKLFDKTSGLESVTAAPAP